MGKKENLQKQIDYLLLKVKIYSTIVIGILSAIIWTIYAIIEKKINQEIYILDGVGIIIVFVFIFRLIFLDKELKEKFDKLDEEE